MKLRLHHACSVRHPPLAALLGGLGAAWLAAAAAASPVPPPAPLPEPALRAAEALAAQAAQARAPAGARVLAQAGPADGRWRLAPCARVEPALAPGAPVWGRTRVALRCADGPVAWTVYLPVRVQVLAPALAPREPLPAGTTLSAALLVPVPADWAASAAPPLADIRQVEGRTLVRSVPAGQALRENDLRRRQWFAGGDRVRLVFSGPGFSVSTEGQALADGYDGQPVRVQLAAADGGRGRVVTGRPAGERLVELGP